uniref:Uncharacterized protein n=1 Tax=Arundo donax TaxID=35708 RepID=A0A0A9D8E5_ARUDO
MQLPSSSTGERRWLATVEKDSTRSSMRRALRSHTESSVSSGKYIGQTAASGSSVVALPPTDWRPFIVSAYMSSGASEPRASGESSRRRRAEPPNKNISRGFARWPVGTAGLGKRRRQEEIFAGRLDVFVTDSWAQNLSTAGAHDSVKPLMAPLFSGRACPTEQPSWASFLAGLPNL